MPSGLIVDREGTPSIDPSDFYDGGAILAFGGHKGSGLSLFCEILAGSLTGGFSSHPTTPTAGRLVNNMLSVVLDPAALSDEGIGLCHAGQPRSRAMCWNQATSVGGR